MTSSPWFRAAAVAVLAAAVAACQHAPPPAAAASNGAAASEAASSDPGRKVMVIVEENHGYGQIIGSAHAPYINRLATDYGTATGYDAGYPAPCPSLAAYILLTSGGTGGICDDKAPKAHRLTGDNIFRQVAASGRQWRDYAESSPGTCALTNDGPYLVRHVPPTYYLNARADCRRWTVPLDNALRDDVAAGTLPAYAFVSPDACHDMHGAPGCPHDLVATGDAWLSTWLPRIMAGPDYRSGRLTVVVTWDEGTATSNHIPAVVVSPAVRRISTNRPLTHCSTLRFAEEQLRLPLLGCAANATSLGSAFGI